MGGRMRDFNGGGENEEILVKYMFDLKEIRGEKDRDFN